MRKKIAFGEGLLHTLDGRARFGTAIVLSFLTASLTSFLPLILSFLLSILLLRLSKPTWKALGRRLLAINAFVLFLWLFLPWSVAGTPLLSVSFLTISQEGVTLSLQISIKANAIFFYFIALISPMSLSELGASMRMLHIPQKLVFLFIFTERSLFFLSEEWTALSSAAKLRAFEARSNFHTYTTIASLLGILLIRSLDHAQRAYEALLLRGFQGTFFSSSEWKATRKDGLFLLAMLLAFCILLSLQLFPDAFSDILSSIQEMPACLLSFL